MPGSLRYRAGHGTFWQELFTDGIDDHVEIQQAIDACAAQGGGVVMLWEGTFDIGARININSSNISIVGQGRSTILEAADALDDNVIRIGAASGQIVGARLENFAVEGNYAGQTLGSPIEDWAGIYFHGNAGADLVDAVFRNLFIEYCAGPGMALDGTNTNPLTRCLIDNVTAIANGLSGACDGIHVAYASDLKVRGVNSQYNTDTGLALDYVTVAAISDSVCRANTSNQFTAARTSTMISYKGCVADGLNLGAYGFRTGKFDDAALGPAGNGQNLTSLITLDGCVAMKCSTSGIHIEDNSVFLVNNTYCPQGAYPSGANNAASLSFVGTTLYSVFGGGNVGIVAQSGGAVSPGVLSGQTSKVVTHGLNAQLAAVVPISLKHITVTPNEQSTTGRLFAVTAVDSTTFTVTLSGDPGASNWDFAWQARLDI